MVKWLQQVNRQKGTSHDPKFSFRSSGERKTGTPISKPWLAVQDRKAYDVKVYPRFKELRLSKAQNVMERENSGCRVLRVNLVYVKRAKWRRVHWGEAYKARRFSV